MAQCEKCKRDRDQFLKCNTNYYLQCTRCDSIEEISEGRYLINKQLEEVKESLVMQEWFKNNPLVIEKITFWEKVKLFFYHLLPKKYWKQINEIRQGDKRK